MNFVSALAKMLNLPLKYGFAPKWWCTLVTVMIEKDPGNPRIEHLRVIHLFEADYNLSLKMLWGETTGIPRWRQQLFRKTTTWISAATPGYKCGTYEDIDIQLDEDTTS
jgi:hypothetical protein